MIIVKKEKEEKMNIFLSMYKSPNGSLFEEIYDPNSKTASFLTWDNPPRFLNSKKSSVSKNNIFSRRANE
jgi:hypothetical protein